MPLPCEYSLNSCLTPGFVGVPVCLDRKVGPPLAYAGDLFEFCCCWAALSPEAPYTLYGKPPPEPALESRFARSKVRLATLKLAGKVGRRLLGLGGKYVMSRWRWPAETQ